MKKDVDMFVQDVPCFEICRPRPMLLFSWGDGDLLVSRGCSWGYSWSAHVRGVPNILGLWLIHSKWMIWGLSPISWSHRATTYPTIFTVMVLIINNLSGNHNISYYTYHDGTYWLWLLMITLYLMQAYQAQYAGFMFVLLTTMGFKTPIGIS